jgi:tRNA-specific 2-thiouridylase
MSGGVDSSVAAARLLEQGHEVVGVTMRLSSSADDDGVSCSVSAVRDARRVCGLLGLTHHVVDFRPQFEREVIAPFARAYARGMTPNPCVVCNERIKFSGLLAEVRSRGADLLATGHYARILADVEDEHRLARGLDPLKDQSYFLYRLTRTQLARVLFPLGESTKREVRAMASRMGLPSAEKPESQDVCFVPNGGWERVVSAYEPHAFRPGDIVDTAGSILGSHGGLARYTVGQRKGLGIGGAGEPYHVVRIEPSSNRVVVGRRDEAQVVSITAREVVWHVGSVCRVEVAVRYRMTPVPALATFDGRDLTLRFDEPLEGVAPGQSAVCYRGDVVVGGGVIVCAN